jgi:uroporphyrinogen-III synthase
MPEPKTLLLTRPEPQARAFAAELEAALPGRFTPVLAPLIAIAPLPAPLDLDGVQALLFTSANGVEQFAARCSDRSLPALCVGAMTAAAATRAGFAARAADGNVEALARLAAETHVSGAGAMLHLRGRHAAGDLTGLLAAAGVPARAAEIYDQRAVAISREAAALLATGRAEVLTFFSARTARIFADQAAAARWPLAAATAVALSAATDAGLGATALGRRLVAPASDQRGMLQALASL